MTTPYLKVVRVWRKPSTLIHFYVMVATSLLALALGMSHAAAAQKHGGDGCGKNETKTDQGCRTNPTILKRTQPNYPPEARKRGVEGSVTMQGRLNEQGELVDVKVVKSDATEVGYVESFKQAAIAAVRDWRYRPATINGEPVSMDMTVSIDFKLTGQ
jgi:TonB family protein